MQVRKVTATMPITDELWDDYEPARRFWRRFMARAALTLLPGGSERLRREDELGRALALRTPAWVVWWAMLARRWSR